MKADHVFLIAGLLSGMFLSIYTKKLSLGASVCGVVIACLLFWGSGYAGVLMIGVFFLLGTAASGWKHRLKVSSDLAESEKERRVASQVLANAGVPALAACISLSFPTLREWCLVAIAAAFASATSDTLSSELGNVYGRRFYNVLTFKKDVRGENGVISLEGSLAGLAGSAIIALVFAAFAGWTYLVAIVLLAGMAGNIFDSVLGATLERKQVIGNDAVNFLNTLFAALLAGGIIYILNF